MIELPRDAEGREIPLDTKALYRKDGSLADVDEFNFSTGYPNPEHKWTVKLTNCDIFFTTKMFLNPPEPPDSWEKLEEDLDKGKDICDYFEECPESLDGKSCSECKKAAPKNIASRIRKLSGEDDA